jgi:hypothetical protein
MVNFEQNLLINERYNNICKRIEIYLEGFGRDKVREILKNRKWQLFCLVLVVTVIVAVNVDIWQSLTASNEGLDGDSHLNSDASEQVSSTSTETNSTFTWLNFTFTWGPESQKIVQSVFCLKISMRLTSGGDVMTLIIESNDDDRNGWDYIGLVFDTNQNGYIDRGDSPCGLFANNQTIPETALDDEGFLWFAEIPITLGPQRVSFNSTTGYTFRISFPAVILRNFHDWDDYDLAACWHPTLFLREENNALHICFHDEDSSDPLLDGGEFVFARFSFDIPEGVEA